MTTLQEPRPSLPLAIKIVLCFLLFDAVERGYQAVDFLMQAEEGESWRAIVFALWISTDLLLILLLSLRTFAGRIWTLVIFAIHMAYLAFHVVSRDKLLWLSLGEIGQARLLITLMLDAFLMHLMTREEVKDYLCE